MRCCLPHFLSNNKNNKSAEGAVHLNMAFVSSPMQRRAAVGIGAVNSRAGRERGFQATHVALARQDVQAASVLKAWRLLS